MTNMIKKGSEVFHHRLGWCIAHKIEGDKIRIAPKGEPYTKINAKGEEILNPWVCRVNRADLKLKD